MNENYPKLHNAAWPGVVGKGPDSEPHIELDKMIEMTAAAEVNDTRFDGIDLFLSEPHLSIDASDDELKTLNDKVSSHELKIGSLVAPVWEPTGGGSAMGSADERKQFLLQVRKACAIGQKLKEMGARPYGIIRVDSATNVSTWAKNPAENTNLLIETFKEAAKIAADHGEQLSAEGEICWGGMHSWKVMKDVLEGVNDADTFGFQADLAHTLLYLLGHNATENRILPDDFSWDDKDSFEAAYKVMVDALRPWTNDLHIAQNDSTVKGSGSHDKTGKHCLPNDPNGKLNITWAAGQWMRDEADNPTNQFKHICWDGCMFDNEVLLKQDTWNEILAAMIAVREAHGNTLQLQQ